MQKKFSLKAPAFSAFSILSILLLFLAPSVSSHASNTTSRYCLYAETQFNGPQRCGSRAQVNWLGWRWHADVSSLRIKQGYELVAYDRLFQFGAVKVFSGDSPELANWNNRMASFRVRKKQADQNKVCFFSRKRFRGKRFCTDSNQLWLAWYWNNTISSVKIPQGTTVKLYDYWGYRGNSLSLTQSTANLRLLGFNNRTSSIEIVNSQAETDADNDGVNDSLDQCPNTPSGAAVSESGCAQSQLDDDQDGVNNDIDQCPQTPPNETSNSDGCALSQLDSDQDNITDHIDQCPDTPAGEEVNEEGCSLNQLDEDNDGITNTLDLCAETPVDESIDANGCGFSQLDTDQDGVNDDVDQCPSTENSGVVDEKGCSGNQTLAPASIILLSPVSTDNVTAGIVSIVGTVASQGDLGVTVNGQIASIDHSQTPKFFSINLELPEGDNEVEVIATNQFGQSASLSSTINVVPGSAMVAELIDDQGFAEFTAQVQFSTETDLRLTSVEIDFDNDKQFEFSQQAKVGEFIDIEQVFERAFDSAGVHFINTQVQDENGVYYQHRLSLNIVDKEQLKAQLVDQWSAMNSAMVNGDIKLALTQLSSEAAPEYQDIFQALQPQFDNIVSQYSLMDCEDTAFEFASCAVVRTNSDGQRSLHFINFGLSGQGIWKISGM